MGGTIALDSFKRDFGLTDDVDAATRDTAQANITSMFAVGAFFGALITFPIAEKIGRRLAILTACLIFMAGGAMMAGAQGSLRLFIAGRAIGGLGIGCATMVVPVYISETAPASVRGRLVGLFEVVSQASAMLGFWINYATDRTIADGRAAQWIVPTAVQLAPVVLLAAGIFCCPESPRWLARADRFDEAERVLVFLRRLPADHPHVRRELAEMRRQVEERSALRHINHHNSSSGRSSSRKQQLAKVLAPGTRNRVGVGAFLMFLQSFTGVNIMTYYSPRIFETLGVTGTATKLFSTGVYGVVKTAGMVLFTLWVVEGLGRRRALVGGAALACLPLFYVGGFCKVADPAAHAVEGVVQQSGWGYFAMACIYVNAFVICATWQGTTWTYASEIFPLDIRMFCVALTTASTWLGSFVVGRATPYMITSLGYGTFFMFGAFVVLMGIWAFFFVPETKGVTLEQMDDLFVRPTHITVWRQLRGKPIVTDDIRSLAGSVDDEKRKEVVHIA
ncbi:hypothetical protein SLS62_003061 [Diatrype stigma]|uniref:Major facilitator superfamily (MFS) profile domain-containing protein n=1 Tax=Diatrype stigma TaxID=117547 RepID=A0AAN9UX89_9PEZI